MEILPFPIVDFPFYWLVETHYLMGLAAVMLLLIPLIMIIFPKYPGEWKQGLLLLVFMVFLGLFGLYFLFFWAVLWTMLIQYKRHKGNTRIPEWLG